MKIKRVSNMRDKVRHGNDIDFNSKILVMGKIDIFIWSSWALRFNCKSCTVVLPSG